MSSEASSAIQAICAVIALAFGIYAYGSWTSQEAAKRNADFALSLMKAGYEAQRCFTSMAASYIRRSYDEKDLEKIIAAGEQKISECNPSFSQLEALAFIARRTLDAETSAAADAYVEVLQGRVERYRSLRSYSRYPLKWRHERSDGTEVSRELLIREAIEYLDGLVFDTDEYSSDAKLKEKAEVWNAAATARRSKGSGGAAASQIARVMNERLTQYVRLKVAH